MARGLATALLRGNQPVQILGRDGARTRTLVESLGPGATGGIIGVPATGSLVFLAIPHGEVRNAILETGGALDGRVVVDISNTVDVSTFDRLTTEPGISAAEVTAELASWAGRRCQSVQHNVPADAGSRLCRRPAFGRVYRR
jgi:hypothetical protein